MHLLERLLTRLHVHHVFQVKLEILFLVGTVCLFSAVLLIGWNVVGRQLSRKAILWIALAWILACTVEYWVFGPYSALGSADEYHASIPFLYYRTHVQGNGTFAHGFAGGVDAIAGLGMGAQFISFEYALFRFLPLWLGVLILNAGAITLAFAGAYRFARADALDRGKALLIALVASVGHSYLFDQSVGGIGWAIAALPAALYLIVQRSQRRHYYVPILALALVFPGPIHELLTLLLAVALSGCLLGTPNISRAIRGAILFASAVFINWIPWTVSVVAGALEGARAGVVEPGVPIWYLLLPSNHDVIILPVGAVCLTLLALRKDLFAWKGALAFLIVLCVGPLLTWVNWKSIGLPVVGAYRWNLLADGYILVLIVIMSRALKLMRWESHRRLVRFRVPPIAAAYFGLIAAISLADHKAANVVNLQLYGGQALFSQVRCLKDVSWQPKDAFRVVTAPTFMSPSTTAAYGLDIFDGMSPALQTRSGLYFGYAVQRPPNPNQNAQYHFINLPDGADQLSASVNLDGLRIANVRFIVSDRQLTDSNLRLVTDCSRYPMVAGKSALERWTAFLAPGALVRPHFVYELGRYWPRVFAPNTVRVSAAGANEQAFYDELLSAPWPPSALIAAGDFPRSGMNLPTGSIEVTEYSMVDSGFDLSVKRTVGNSGSAGLVVINAPYSSFWRATAGKGRFAILPVNATQFGIIVDGDPGRIQVRYEPPTLTHLAAVSAGRVL